MLTGYSDTPTPDGDEPALVEMDANFGPRLRTARNWHGWTADDLALRSGVVPAEIARLEAATSPIASGDVLVDLADALGVSLEWLMVGRLSARDVSDLYAALGDEHAAIAAAILNPMRH